MTKPTDIENTENRAGAGGSAGAALLCDHPYRDAKWGVHIIGLDNVLAANSFHEAVFRCHDINLMVLNHLKSIAGNQNLDNGHIPRVVAQVGVWSDISNAPHEPHKTNWNDPFA